MLTITNIKGVQVIFKRDSVDEFKGDTFGKLKLKHPIYKQNISISTGIKQFDIVHLFSKPYETLSVNNSTNIFWKYNITVQYSDGFRRVFKNSISKEREKKYRFHLN